MKTLPLVATLLAAAAAGPLWAAGFTGAAAPANFTVSNTGVLDAPATPGLAAFSAVDLLMAGADSGGSGCSGGSQSVIGPCELLVSLALPGTYSFDFAYVSNDSAGPAYDRFGVIVDGVRTDFTDPGGPVNQSGTGLSFTASASFGWFLNCTDCTGGNARALVTHFSTTAVPEPAALALALAGLAGVGAAVKRQGRRAA